MPNKLLLRRGLSVQGSRPALSWDTSLKCWWQPGRHILPGACTHPSSCLPVTSPHRVPCSHTSWAHVCKRHHGLCFLYFEGHHGTRSLAAGPGLPLASPRRPPCPQPSPQGPSSSPRGQIRPEALPPTPKFPEGLEVDREYKLLGLSSFTVDKNLLGSF